MTFSGPAVYVGTYHKYNCGSIFGKWFDLAEMLGLTGTPGIIVMPAENATPDNTTVIPGVVSEQVMQQAIARAAKG